MNREAELRSLAQRLQAAGEAGEWRALAVIDRELAGRWEKFVAHGPWTASERQALAVLHQAHSEAAALCGREVQRLQERLAELRLNKEGWMAYAVGSEWEGDRT
jgi:hypothetical protein